MPARAGFAEMSTREQTTNFEFATSVTLLFESDSSDAVFLIYLPWVCPAIYGSCRKYSAVTRTQTRLLTIAKPHPAASIVDLTARRQFELPIGTDNEDLVCGTCGMVVLSGWSVSSTGKRLVGRFN